MDNPYIRSKSTIEEPPESFFGRLKYIGPGFILSASIVGSGELIATTAFGAKAGFIFLWIILLSCLIKVALQLEFGKHAIAHGESTLAAFNQLPGPRFGKANWAVWTWLILMCTKFLQVGGIVGIVAVIAGLAIPDLLPVEGWCILFAVITSLLVYKGKYQLLEKLSLVLIGLFTVLTFLSLYGLQDTVYAISGENIFSGLNFQLPADSAMLLLAAGAFGLTGVSGDEIMHYIYWLVEKGYAAKTGPRDDTPEWERRAKGWIKVMYLDALLAMLVYTVMTAAFYLLGAAVLHARGELPEGSDLVVSLSTMYTETLGPWAETAFMVGAFVVLFSTLFSALGAWTRTFADAFGQIGFIDFLKKESRHKAIAILAWVIPMLWTLSYFLIKKPKFMVIFGGAVTTVILMLVVFAGLHFRFRRLPESLKPGKFYGTAFMLSAISIALVGLFAIAKPFF